AQIITKACADDQDTARAVICSGTRRFQDFAWSFWSFGVASCFISSGYWNAAKMNVSGITPNTLKLTQVSVDCVRQTISLSTASTRKNNAQRMVSLRQPSSVRWNTWSNTIASSGFL